jgi:hypothetical protein
MYPYPQQQHAYALNAYAAPHPAPVYPHAYPAPPPQPTYQIPMEPKARARGPDDDFASGRAPKTTCSTDLRLASRLGEIHSVPESQVNANCAHLSQPDSDAD